MDEGIRLTTGRGLRRTQSGGYAGIASSSPVSVIDRSRISTAMRTSSSLMMSGGSKRITRGLFNVNAAHMPCLSI